MTIYMNPDKRQEIITRVCELLTSMKRLRRYHARILAYLQAVACYETGAEWGRSIKGRRNLAVDLCLTVLDRFPSIQKTAIRKAERSIATWWRPGALERRYGALERR